MQALQWPAYFFYYSTVKLPDATSSGNTQDTASPGKAQDTTAPGNTQDTTSPSGANQEEPVRIIEEEGNIEIIVPEDEETFGE